MKFSITLRISGPAFKKSDLANMLISEIQHYVRERNYGAGVEEYVILLQIVDPPVGYEHLFKPLKPRFTDHKITRSKFTGQTIEVNKHFSYSIELTGERYKIFTEGSDGQSLKELADLIVNSLSFLDKLPGKIDFDREKFITDVQCFFNCRIKTR